MVGDKKIIRDFVRGGHLENIDYSGRTDYVGVSLMRLSASRPASSPIKKYSYFMQAMNML